MITVSKLSRLAIGCTCLALAQAAAAAPKTYELPEETAAFAPGTGQDVAQANCMACHSADYISMQPPKKGAAFWSAEVTKMIKVYGAPIADEDAKTIAAYLAAAY